MSSGAESSGESETLNNNSNVKHSSRRQIRSKLSKSQPDLSALSLADRENTLLRHTLGNTRYIGLLKNLKHGIVLLI